MKAEGVVKAFEVGRGMFKAKKSIKAVDSVTLNVKEGEILSLIGESGCGKSTLGRLMLALLKPSSGRILYMGKDIWRLKGEEFKEYRRNAQIIPQDPYSTLNPMKKVSSALIPPLLHYKIARGRGEAKKMASELLEIVGLSPPDDFLERYPARLSGGQMQRISIARALTIRPKFIVADEAVSMLDVSLRIEILDLLLKAKDMFKTTYLFITHDFGMARYFARDGGIAVMYLGNIAEIGETEEVIHKPMHPYTKTLLMATPTPDPKLARERSPPPLKSIEIPSLVNPPPGCKFHTRCPYAEKLCEEKAPELIGINGRQVACHMV